MVNLFLELGNTPPIANDFYLTIDEDEVLSGEILGFDLDGDPLSYSIVSLPNYGQLEVDFPSIRYIPNKDFSGSDFLTYRVSDVLEQSAVG